MKLFILVLSILLSVNTDVLAKKNETMVIKWADQPWKTNPPYIDEYVKEIDEIHKNPRLKSPKAMASCDKKNGLGKLRCKQKIQDVHYEKYHSRGHKVELRDGTIGRIVQLVSRR